jgi:nifR3 family TIM-barrel protein
MNNFWQKLKKPIMCSAPMSGVTDAAFRFILAKYGKPDIIFTEFVSCDGLCSEGKERLLLQLRYDELERPIVAQLFGATPEYFYKSAKLCQKLGFNGIDINMGCPDKDVIRQKAGAVLIQNSKSAAKIIKSTKEGAGVLPVSVKTRLGYSVIETEKWISFLLKQNLAVITIHGRTKKQRYTGKVYWNEIEKAKKIAQKISPKTLIVGNGDIKTLREARILAKKYNLDGIMIGRALLSNPFLFNRDNSVRSKKIEILIEHAQLFEKFYPNRNFSDIKKFYKAYISEFPGASRFRLELMEANNAKELKRYIIKHRTHNT